VEVMAKIEEYRARAKACQELADAAADPKAKESYQTLACSWIKLAEYRQVTKKAEIGDAQASGQTTGGIA
jgi:hypothetical protein